MATSTYSTRVLMENTWLAFFWFLRFICDFITTFPPLCLLLCVFSHAKFALFLHLVLCSLRLGAPLEPFHFSCLLVSFLMYIKREQKASVFNPKNQEHIHQEVKRNTAVFWGLICYKLEKNQSYLSYREQCILFELSFGHALIFTIRFYSVQGANYLVFVSCRSLKTKELSFAQFVYFLREVCLFFNFWMIKFTIMQKKHNCKFYHSKIEK